MVFQITKSFLLTFLQKSKLPLFKYEKCSENNEDEADKVVPSELFFEIEYCKTAEYKQGNNFLYCFQLCCRINFIAYSVCRHLKAVFKKRNSPADKNHKPQNRTSEFEVSVPRKCHKYI